MVWLTSESDIFRVEKCEMEEQDTLNDRLADEIGN